MTTILAGQNQTVLRYLIIMVVLMALWLHWRAAYLQEVRTALNELPESAERLDDVLQDVRDRRLIHRCRAVLSDQMTGDDTLYEEHLADAHERLDHLETFAPLRRFMRPN